MDVHKRGDHLFATGLAKTIAEVVEKVDREISETSEGRTLLESLSQCTRLLTSGTFDAVIDKGKPVQHDDLQSTTFGKAAQDLRLQMTSLIEAVRFRRGIDAKDAAARKADLELANRQLATAKRYAILTVGQFFDLAVDEDVARRLMGTPLRGDITKARALLDDLRRSICRRIERM